MIFDLLPYVAVFLASLVVTLLVTPIVREMNRRLGMVDRPDPRRINKVPIPRGGGVALVFGIFVPYLAFHLATGRPWIQGLSDSQGYALAVLGIAITLLGFADDRFSLSPKVKLLGQVVIAVLVWAWAGLGFRVLWSGLPAGIDCFLTVFWVVGAVNAFNLIDGLDGLASGLALIAAIGMAGGLFFAHNPQATLFYFALTGGLLGFLRYNYNPASVFLGDSGSMFLGFILSTLPLASQAPNSFLVSVGMPFLAMGVPIFDTALAILRRSVRHLLARRLNNGSERAGEVMMADSDHLHHRILRSVGLNQRKAAWILYGFALALVATGLVAMLLQSHAAGLWLAALTVASVVIFKDARIELFDAGHLLNVVAHAHDSQSRRRLAVLSVPFYVFLDILTLVFVFFVCAWALRMKIDIHLFRTDLPVRIASVFAFLVFFRTYRTAWSRALISNYMRLFLACVFGAIASSVFIYYWPSTSIFQLKAMTLTFAVASFTALLSLRVFRGLVRDLFYAIDCSRLKGRKDVSRILVYGTGLRYRAFRRELVRTTAANSRMIVGLIDDNVYLKGNYIGGIRVCGTINDAPEIINALNADAVVVACQISETWKKVVCEILRPTGVKLTIFSFSEKPLEEVP